MPRERGDSLFVWGIVTVEGHDRGGDGVEGLRQRERIFLHLLDDGGEELLVLFGEETITAGLCGTVDKAEATKNEDLGLVEGKGEAELALRNELKNLDDAFTRVADGKEGGGSVLLDGRSNDGAMDQGTNVMVGKGLQMLAKSCQCSSDIVTNRGERLWTTLVAGMPFTNSILK